MFRFNKEIFNISLFWTAAAALIVSFLIFYNGFYSYSIKGIRKENGRVEFTFSDEHMYFFSTDTKQVAPVTNISLIGSEEENNEHIILYTTKFKHKISSSDGLKRDEILSLFVELKAFMEDREKTGFTKSYYFAKMNGFIGLILCLLLVYFMIIQFRKIPNPFRLLFVFVKGKSKQIIEKKKKQIREKKETAPPKQKVLKGKKKHGPQEVDSKEKLLKVIITAHDDIDLKPEEFNIPGLHSIALVCPPKMSKKLKEEYGDNCTVISCKEMKGTSGIINCAKEWIGDFNGYLMVQTADIPDLKSETVEKLYEEHLKAENECSILTKNTKDMPEGTPVIFRNVANRIIKLSQGPDGPAEYFSGLYCFNATKFFDYFRRLGTDSSLEDVPLSKIIEIYSNKKARVNSISTGDKERPVLQLNTTAVYGTKTKSESKPAALILAVDNSDPEDIRNAVEAVSIKETGKKAIILKSEEKDNFDHILNDNFEIMTTKPGLGEGFTALQADKWLKNEKCDVLTIAEQKFPLNKDIVRSLLKDHKNSGTVCTLVRKGENIVLYCGESDLFFYAVKRISKNDDTDQYYLEDIGRILTNDNKKVREIDISSL